MYTKVHIHTDTHGDCEHPALQFIGIFTCGCYRNGRHHRKKYCHYLFLLSLSVNRTHKYGRRVSFLSEVDNSCQDF